MKKSMLFKWQTSEISSESDDDGWKQLNKRHDKRERPASSLIESSNTNKNIRACIEEEKNRWNLKW